MMGTLFLSGSMDCFYCEMLTFGINSSFISSSLFFTLEEVENYKLSEDKNVEAITPDAF